MRNSIVIGSDHAGYCLKEKIKGMLAEKKYQVIDKGTDSDEKCDYPDYAYKVAKEVAKGKSLGILICGTGIGMSIAANKVKGIRAALCCNEFMAKSAREHNDANILCLGARVLEEKEALKIVDAFLGSDFSKEERHVKRVRKMMALENKK